MSYCILILIFFLDFRESGKIELSGRILFIDKLYFYCVVCFLYIYKIFEKL